MKRPNEPCDALLWQSVKHSTLRQFGSARDLVAFATQPAHEKTLLFVRQTKRCIGLYLPEGPVRYATYGSPGILVPNPHVFTLKAAANDGHDGTHIDGIRFEIEEGKTLNYALFFPERIIKSLYVNNRQISPLESALCPWRTPESR